MGRSHSLADKYEAESGSVFMSGTQALVRLPMAQMRRDRRNGHNTATYITGYRGSPLGGYDQHLHKSSAMLTAHDVAFHPGVNEELAATAIWGTQQVPLYQKAQKEGVVGIWYGKGPGVDRSGDVLRHANAAGSAALGGVLCLVGDDHAAKSSTVPHQSDHAFISSGMPLLFPSSVHEFIELGLLGIAMSRYSGCWVGMKVISDTIETSAVVELSDEYREFVEPTDFNMPKEGLNIRWPDPPLVQDARLNELKIDAALAFAKANKVDQLVVETEYASFGIVASGKAYEETRQALTVLGIDESAMQVLAMRLYKVRMIWPLEPTGIKEFSEGLDEILVLEERREIIESQIKEQLFNQAAQKPLIVVGKRDENGQPFLPVSQTLSIAVCANAIAKRLLKRNLPDSMRALIESNLNNMNALLVSRGSRVVPIERQPWFCSGCPHNSSTKVPEGSKALAGIGCHYMVQWMDRNTDTFTQMGAEGMPWTAIANYVEDDHRFVNIGDGTYYHSGVLAIRGAVASGVNVTYKVLYNDAVAMTGGQSLDGNLSAEQVCAQLLAEGVSPVCIVSDEPEKLNAQAIPAGVRVEHRDQYDQVMRELRVLKGCNAIVYAQTCAAEKRRRRKRGLLEDPAKRLFINSAVCEGCGDCSVQSNCVSVEPHETEFGRKRRINQSSCNKDYSCANGFCPSFVTVTGGELYKQAAQSLDSNDQLTEPALPKLDANSWNVLITGVGGTGVLTIGSIVGMAAHIDGNAAMILDFTGLAQKGGAVASHVRIAKQTQQVTSPHIIPGGADLLIAADSVVAASKESATLLNAERTHGVVNTATAPVSRFVLERDLDFKHDAVAKTILANVQGPEHFHAFSSVAEQLTGDSIYSNILMLGYAWQRGLLPLSLNALQQAITLNGVQVDANLSAFTWGRLLAAKPDAVQAKLVGQQSAPTLNGLSINALIAHRQEHLTQYQNNRLAKKYSNGIDQLRSVARMLAKAASTELQPFLDESELQSLVRSAAINYSRVLSYKDEYEVARLFSSSAFKEELQQQFTGDYKISLNLAPPIFSKTTALGRPAKREFGAWMLKLLSLLKKFKWLRTTPVNPFGFTPERKSERELIAQYASDISLVSKLLENPINITVDKLELMHQLLELPGSIRGYGPVKLQALELAQQNRKEVLSRLNAEEPQPLANVA